jgi:hypothetical protein
MKAIKYAKFINQVDMKSLREEAGRMAHNWLESNMANSPKFIDQRRVAYQSYMNSYIRSYLRAEFKKVS